MRLVIRPEAEADLAQAYAWYQMQRPGLGIEFRRFPYALFFATRNDEVMVIAAFHMARHPDALMKRVRRSLGNRPT